MYYWVLMRYVNYPTLGPHKKNTLKAVDLGPTQMWGSGGFCDRLAVSPPSQESSGSVEPRDVVSDRCAQMGSPLRVRQAASLSAHYRGQKDH